MLKRLFSFLLGIALVASVIFLGLEARDNQSFVVWFGLAAAILTPAGFAAVGYAFTTGERKLLERLSKVPEIQNLINEAKSQEEKIRLLEQERSRLIEIVQLEARKQALATRKESLEEDGVRILEELEVVDKELNSIQTTVQSTPVTQELAKLQERLQAWRNKDIIISFGPKEFILKRERFYSFPFGGLIYEYFRFGEFISEKVINLLFGDKANRSFQK